MKNILVTGGSGFIGSHLCQKLLDKGFSVISIDNFSRGLESRKIKSIKNIKCDITDYDDLSLKLKDIKIDCVFHLAAINGTDNFYRIPLKIMDVGVLGAINICKLCIEKKINKLIAASSAEVYQESKIIPTPEDIELVVPNVENPRYSYGLSKIFTEYYIYHFCNINNISGAAFRPHNVYGPDMGLKHVIPQFIIQMLTNANEKETELKPEGNINTTRAFCYVDDITDGLITLMGTDNFEVYNIGSDLEISIRDLAYMLSSSLDLSLFMPIGWIPFFIQKDSVLLFSFLFL